MKKAVLLARPIQIAQIIKKPWSTSGVPHGLDFTSSRHTGSRQTPPMQLRHHQLVFERIVFDIMISPTACLYSRPRPTCQYGLSGPHQRRHGGGIPLEGGLRNAVQRPAVQADHPPGVRISLDDLRVKVRA